MSWSRRPGRRMAGSMMSGLKRVGKETRSFMGCFSPRNGSSISTQMLLWQECSSIAEVGKTRGQGYRRLQSWWDYIPWGEGGRGGTAFAGSFVFNYNKLILNCRADTTVFLSLLFQRQNSIYQVGVIMAKGGHKSDMEVTCHPGDLFPKKRSGFNFFSMTSYFSPASMTSWVKGTLEEE